MEAKKAAPRHSWKAYAASVLATLAILVLIALALPQKDAGVEEAAPVPSPYSPPGKAACAYGDSAACNVSGCPGERKCAGGAFGACELPARVCVPGKRVGCSLNGCSFGYRVCNECGTGFGECLPGELSAAIYMDNCSG